MPRIEPGNREVCKYYYSFEIPMREGSVLHCGENDRTMSEQHINSVMTHFCWSKEKCTGCNYYKEYEKERLENTMIENHEIAPISNSTSLSAKNEAMAVHQQIKFNAETAASALVEMGKGLKVMRDKTLYKELGFESFSEYVEKNGDYSFKERQAYTYIKAFEDLGERFLQSNAELGITKLELLTKLPAYERDDFLEENDIAGLSVSEVQELIKKSQNQGEQISFLTAELEEKKTEDKETIELRKEVERMKIVLDCAKKERTSLEEKHLEAETESCDLISQLQTALEELKSAPVDVAVAEPSAEEIEKIKADAKAEAEKEYKAKLKKQKEKEQADKDKLEADIKKKYEQQIADEKTKAEAEKQELETKIKKGTSDESKIAFKFYFSEIQKNLQGFIDIIKKIDDEATKSKCKMGLTLYIKKVLEEIDETESPEENIEESQKPLDIDDLTEDTDDESEAN